MSDAYMLLPLLEGWRRESFTRLAAETLRAGGAKRYIDFKEETGGWLDSAGGTVTDPNVILTAIVDGVVLQRFTPSDLNTLGRNQANNGSPYLELYDTVNSLYAVSYTPSIPLPFRKSCQIQLENPTGAAVTVQEFYGLTIVIFDPVAFVKSLQAVLGTKHAGA